MMVCIPSNKIPIELIPIHRRSPEITLCSFLTFSHRSVKSQTFWLVKNLLTSGHCVASTNINSTFSLLYMRLYTNNRIDKNQNQLSQIPLALRHHQNLQVIDYNMQ